MRERTKGFALRMVKMYLALPKNRESLFQLLGSPENAERLRKAIASKTPEHLIFETTEDVKRALGI